MDSLTFWRIMQFGIGPLVGTCIVLFSHLKIEKIKSMSVKEKENGNINISGNSGNIIVNGSNNTQVINNKITIEKRVRVTQKTNTDGLNILRLSMHQTPGVWASGRSFWIRLKLSGSYINHKWLGGYDKPITDLFMSDKESAKTGYFEFKTTTPPKNEVIILEIYSYEKLQIEQMAISPMEGDPDNDSY